MTRNDGREQTNGAVKFNAPLRAIDDYLINTYPAASEQLDEIGRYIQQSSNLLIRSCITETTPERTYWPYSFPKKITPGSLSVSTQAMCAAAVDRLKDFPQELRGIDKLSELAETVLKTIFKQIEAELSSEGSGWKSTTFGKEDIFTASWLIDVLSRRTAAPEKVVSASVRVVATVLQSASKKNFEETLFDPEDNEAGPHPLPLLRALQSVTLIERTPHLAKTTGTPILSKNDMVLVGHWFERNLHRQMSFYTFGDFRFDAAEMIFCLKGAIETGALTEYDDTIEKVLGIVRDAQDRSVYWRPYRPMKSTSRGMTLLPLSIEVASTLLDVMQRTRLFDTYEDTLSKYYSWLVSQRVVENSQGSKSVEHWVGGILRTHTNQLQFMYGTPRE